MFLKKGKYNELINKIKKLEDIVNLQKFELYSEKNKEKYHKCSLPNNLNEVAFYGLNTEEQLMEFMLLAQKKGIDISDIPLRKMSYGERVVISNNKAEIHAYVPSADFGGYSVHSVHQKELIRNIPSWSDIRKSFEQYILN